MLYNFGKKKFHRIKVPMKIDINFSPWKYFVSLIVVTLHDYKDTLTMKISQFRQMESIILIRILCVSVCVCVSRKISGLGHHTTMFLFPAERALSGELHKLLDKFLTQMQNVNALFAPLRGFVLIRLLCMCVCVSSARCW